MAHEPGRRCRRSLAGLIHPVVTLPAVEIGLGCVNLGSASARTSEAEQVRLIRQAIDEGVTVFDTADVYGAGSSERLLGRALQNRRDAVTIATKGGYAFRPRHQVEQRLRRAAAHAQRSIRPGSTQLASTDQRSGYAQQDFSAANLRRRINDSLRRLRVDHIDVYQLHGPGERTDDLLGALDDLLTRGVVGRFGIGAKSVETASSWSSDPHVSVVQVPFGVLDPAARAALPSRATAGDIDVWARSVLGGGLISSALYAPTTVSAHPKAALIDSLMRIASDAGMGLDELAVRWVVAHRDIAVVLLGMSSSGHLKRNMDLLRLPPLELAIVHRVTDAASHFVDGDPR